MPVPSRTSLLWSVLSALALVAAILVIFFVGSGAIKKTLDDAFATQRALGDVQRYTDLTIRRQLDEEAAIRGFVESGRRLYLEPYATATRRFDVTVEALSDALDRAGLGSERASVAQAAAANGQWVRDVARPLLADPSRPDRPFLEVRGKTLVDRFRASLAQIDRAVLERTAVQTTVASQAVSRVGGLGLLAVLAVAFVVIFSLQIQSRLERELRVERRVTAAIQRGLLQRTLPELASIVFDASYVPAGREAYVGGDWYDVLVLDDGRVMFSIGDVAGHGVEAAIVMSRAREALVALGYTDDDPARVLARVNDVLVVQGSQVATALFGYVDQATHLVTYALAGHPPPLVATPNRAPYFLPYGGVPLGIGRDQTFENRTFAAAPGSAMILYTDGFIERTRDVFAGERELIAAAARLQPSGYASLATRIHREIFGDAVPGDDAAVVTIAFAEPSLECGDDDRDGTNPLARAARTTVA